MATQEEQNEPIQSLEVQTAFGKLAAKGMRLSDLLTLIGVALSAVVLVMVLRSSDSVADHNHMAEKAFSNMQAILIENVKTNRLQTCILSQPQEKRQQEFTNANSLCRTLAGM